MACKIDKKRGKTYIYIYIYTVIYIIVIAQNIDHLAYEQAPSKTAVSLEYAHKLIAACTAITSRLRFHHAFTRIDPVNLAGSWTMFSAISPAAGEVTPEAAGPTDLNPQQNQTGRQPLT